MTSTSSSGQSDDLSDQGDGASASGGIACRKGQRRRLWSPAEDERLLALVRKHGARDWAAIAAELGEARSSRSCRIRYVNQLSYSDTKVSWKRLTVCLGRSERVEVPAVSG